MDHFNTEQVLMYLTVFTLACFAGVVDFVNKLTKLKEKPPMKTVLFNLFAKLLMSAFAGLLTFWILQERAEDGIVLLNGYSAMAISLSGYAGNQTVNIFSSIWQAIIEKGKNK